MIDERKKVGGTIIDRKIDLLKIFTPVIMTLILFIVGGLSFQIRAIDTKLFTHLTNHELHVPRGQITTKSEFSLHCMSSEQMRNDVKDNMHKVESNLKDFIRANK